MAVTVADLLVKLDMDDSDFKKGADSSSSHLSGKFASALKAGAVAAGTAAMAGLVSAFGAMKQLEDAFVPIGTILGATTPEFDKMSEAIKGVMRTSPKSAEELGSAAYLILSAGISDAEQATLALRDANNLALAGLGTVAEAAGVITSAMNSWKSENLSSTDAAEILFGTILSGKTTLSALAQGFGGVAPLASSLGISFKELMAATASLTAVGRPASEVYSGLKAAISNITKPTADAETMAKKLGLSFDGNSLKAKGLEGFLGDLQTAIGVAADQGISANDVITALFGSVEAQGAMFDLTGGQAQSFADNLVGVAAKGALLDERAKEVSNTLSNRFLAAKNRSMIALSDWGTKGLDWLTLKYNEHKEQVDAALTLIREKWYWAFGGVVGLIVENWPAISQVLIDGITTVKDFFVQHWDTIKNTVTTVLNAIQVASQFVVEWFKANWPAIRDVVVEVFGKLVEAGGLVVTWFQAQWPLFQDLLVGVFNQVKDVAIQFWSAAQLIVAWFVENWPQIWATIQPVMTMVWELIKTILTMLAIQFAITTTAVLAIWSLFGDDLLRILGFALDFILPIIQGFARILTGIFQIIRGLLTGDWSLMWDGIKNIAGGAVTIIVNVIRTGFELLWNIIGWIGQIGAGIITGFLQGMWSVIGNVWSWLSGLPGDIWRILSGLFEMGSSIGGNLIKGMYNGIISWAGRLWDAVWETATGPARAVKRFFGFGSPSKLMRDYGRWTMQGFELGLKDEQKSLTGAAVSAFGSITQAGITNNTNAISSASSAVGPITVNMPPGSNGDDVVRALRQWQDRNGTLPIRAAV